MRALIGILALAASLAPTVASACVSAPPPYWPMVFEQGKWPVAIGRILDIKPEPQPMIGPRFEVSQATATIELLEAVQGQTSPQVTYTAATAVRLREGQPALDGWCGNWMNLTRDEIVVVIEEPAGRASVFRRDRVPPELLARMDKFE